MPTMPSRCLPADGDPPHHARVVTDKGVYHVDRLALDIMHGNVKQSMCSLDGISIYCMPCAAVIANDQIAMHAGHRRIPLTDIKMKIMTCLDDRLARIENVDKLCADVDGRLVKLNIRYGDYVTDMIVEQHKKFVKYFEDRKDVDKEIGEWLLAEQLSNQTNQEHIKRFRLKGRGLSEQLLQIKQIILNQSFMDSTEDDEISAAIVLIKHTDHHFEKTTEKINEIDKMIPKDRRRYMYEETDAMFRKIIKIDDSKDCNSISRPDIDSSQTHSKSSLDNREQNSNEASGESVVCSLTGIRKNARSGKTTSSQTSSILGSANCSFSQANRTKTMRAAIPRFNRETQKDPRNIGDVDEIDDFLCKEPSLPSESVTITDSGSTWGRLLVTSSRQSLRSDELLKSIYHVSINIDKPFIRMHKPSRRIHQGSISSHQTSRRIHQTSISRHEPSIGRHIVAAHRSAPPQSSDADEQASWSFYDLDGRGPGYEIEYRRRRQRSLSFRSME